MVFGEADMACDVPEPYKFPSLDSCQKRYLWTYKEVDLVEVVDKSHVLNFLTPVGETPTHE